MLPNLKTLRNERNISQKKLAEILGVRQQTISNYENCNIEPDIELLSRMADYFDTSIDYIVGRIGPRGQSRQGEIVELSQSEYELIARYRRLSDKEKQCIQLMTDTLTEK